MAVFCRAILNLNWTAGIQLRVAGLKKMRIQLAVFGNFKLKFYRWYDSAGCWVAKNTHSLVLYGKTHSKRLRRNLADSLFHLILPFIFNYICKFFVNVLQYPVLKALFADWFVR